jgi:hypothetical protein
VQVVILLQYVRNKPKPAGRKTTEIMYECMIIYFLFWHSLVTVILIYLSLLRYGRGLISELSYLPVTFSSSFGELSFRLTLLPRSLRSSTAALDCLENN